MKRLVLVSAVLLATSFVVVAEADAGCRRKCRTRTIVRTTVETTVDAAECVTRAVLKRLPRLRFRRCCCSEEVAAPVTPPAPE